MAKVALLIGISEYGEGLSALPGTQEDISILQRVLQSPQIGGFDQVDLLPNPDRTQMERAIETLFTENRDRNDLVLLYFSGHGVRDDNGTLYFANRITEKNTQGRILTSTAVPASALQHYMSRSRSKRLGLILDCCFSGAFANDMKAKAADEAVDVKAQLGGEGRAVLTSSTATQVSYEKEGASIYTRYLVQGLETGAADRNEDGQITVDELHEYAREKVQEAAPTMQPEIYAVREGYKILLARAPQGDPKLIFRKELNARAKLKQGKLSPIDQRAFKFRGQQLGLSLEDSKRIEAEVLQPYQEFWAKLNEFEQAVKDVLDFDPQLSAASLDDLQYFQGVLNLRDVDIIPILNTYHLHLNSQPNVNPVRTASEESSDVVINPMAKTVSSSKSKVNELFILENMEDLFFNSSDSSSEKGEASKHHLSQPLSSFETKVNKPFRPENMDDLFSERSDLNSEKEIDLEDLFFDRSDLSSEKGIDYTKLRDLLKAQKWKEADQETYEVMIRAVEKKSGDWFSSDELLNFPCTDLKTIDGLWVKYSKGQFGFSVQKQIYVECGAKLDGKYPGDKIWERFCDRVGWRKDGQWLHHSDLSPSLSSQKGFFPIVWCDEIFFSNWFLFSRAETCKV